MRAEAQRVGNPDFFAFGEVFDANPAYTSTFTTTGRLDATLDFGFQGSGTNFAKGTATTGLRDFYASDDYYTDTDSNAYSLPTFLGNHDMGRIGMFLDADHDGDELLSRDKLAHALMYLGRGQPVVYYGDEQGFTGDGGDQLARQDMFPSRVDVYNDDDLIGTDATTADANFDTGHPLYRAIGALARLRETVPRAWRRSTAAPVRQQPSGCLRVQPDLDEREARVRRRAQQRRRAQDRDLPDPDEARDLQADLAGHQQTAALRLREAGHADRAATVGAGLPGQREGGAPPGRAGDPLRQPECGWHRRRSGRDRGRRLRCRRPGLQPGHPGVATSRWHRLDSPRHRRQRAVPRLPRRVRDAQGHDAGVPRGAARHQRQPVGDLDVRGRRRPERRPGRWSRPGRSSRTTSRCRARTTPRSAAPAATGCPTAARRSWPSTPRTRSGSRP